MTVDQLVECVPCTRCNRLIDRMRSGTCVASWASENSGAALKHKTLVTHGRALTTCCFEQALPLLPVYTAALLLSSRAACLLLGFIVRPRPCSMFFSADNLVCPWRPCRSVDCCCRVLPHLGHPSSGREEGLGRAVGTVSNGVNASRDDSENIARD